MNLIGLNGFARSGKDAAASALVADGWHRVAFADTLRDMAYAIDPYVKTFEFKPEGWDSFVPGVRRLSALIDAHGWEYAKSEYPDVRRLLQRLGTEAGRDILGDSIWVDTAFKQSESHPRRVFTDVRFPNEADAIKAHGGIVVRINRPGVGPVNTHASDNSMSDYPFDSVIENSGTLAALHIAIKELAYA